MPNAEIKTLFLDIGGVLLTNAWGRSSRALAATKFQLDLAELNERHHLCFDTYEMGKLSMDDYLHQTVFYETRNFSQDDFKAFIYAQSTAYPENIAYFKELKNKYKVKVISINNEAREMNEFRISEFRLHELFDAFVSSCYVHMRKPDVEIFKIACDLAQTKPEQAVMIDDRSMFVEVARSIGLNAIVFDELDSVKKQLSALLR